MSEKIEQEYIEELLSIPAESRTIEFKRLGSNFNVSKVIETLVAMTNTDGGFIILGIGDPQQDKSKGLDRVYGIEESFEKYDEIGRNIQRIIPPISISGEPSLLHCTNNRTIAVIYVPKAVNGFHTIDNHVFIRLEKGNKLLTPHEIVKLSYAKGFQQADKELVDVDFDLLRTKQV
jgi:predicted HTH transcriptional regulator